MNLVNEKHRAVGFFKISEDRLEPLLKISPIFRPCKQGAEIKRINRAAHEGLRHFAFYDLSGETLGYRCFADARLTHVQRIILASAAQNLHRARDFKIPPNQRINLPRDGLLVKINRERRQGTLKVLIG